MISSDDMYYMDHNNNKSNNVNDNNKSVIPNDRINHYPRQFDLFMQNTFGVGENKLYYDTSKKFFESWDITTTLWNNSNLWKPPNSYTHLYILSNASIDSIVVDVSNIEDTNIKDNNNTNIKTNPSHHHQKQKKLYIGISNDIKHRLDQLNGLVSGGSTQSKKNAGLWRITFVARFPPLINYPLTEIRHQIKPVVGEKIVYRYLRVLRLIDCLSLEYFISHKLIDKSSEFYQELLHDHIENLKNHGKFTHEKNLLPKEIVDLI